MDLICITIKYWTKQGYSRFSNWFTLVFLVPRGWIACPLFTPTRWQNTASTTQNVDRQKTSTYRNVDRPNLRQATTTTLQNFCAILESMFFRVTLHNSCDKIYILAPTLIPTDTTLCNSCYVFHTYMHQCTGQKSSYKMPISVPLHLTWFVRCTLYISSHALCIVLYAWYITAHTICIILGCTYQYQNALSDLWGVFRYI